MGKVTLFALDFHSASEIPTKLGEYILYNKCYGFNLVYALFSEENSDEFLGFHSTDMRTERLRKRFWNLSQLQTDIDRDFYVAWAKLPNILDLYSAFSPQ